MGDVGSLTFNGASNTVVMGEVGAHNRGGMPPGQEARTISQIINIVLVNQWAYAN